MKENKIKINYINKNKLEDLKQSKKYCKVATIQHCFEGIIFGGFATYFAPNIPFTIISVFGFVAAGVCATMMNNIDQEIKEYRNKPKINKRRI